MGQDNEEYVLYLSLMHRSEHTAIIVHRGSPSAEKAPM